MKDMSYRDKMIILVITVIIILVAGFFALIRPKYQTLVADTAAYETTKTEWDGIQQKLEAIPVLKETITGTYQEAKKTAEIFENEAFQTINDDFAMERATFTMDQYLQPLIDESHLVVSSIGVDSYGSTSVTFYYYTPNAVSYALLEAADINGNYAKSIEELGATDAVLSERTSADLLTDSINLSVEGKREDLMTFLDMVKEDENAMLATNINIGDYNFKGGLQATTVTDEEGNVTTIQPSGDGTSSLTLTLTLFNAKPIDEPDLGD